MELRGVTAPLGAPDAGPSGPGTRHRLELVLDERCRALARVIAILEGRGLQVLDVRLWPAGHGRARSEAVIDVVEGPVLPGRPAANADDPLAGGLIAQVEALPSVRSAALRRPDRSALSA